MNYIGSKHSLLPFIEKIFLKIRDNQVTTFCDIFAGTGAVGRHFKQLGLRVIANDFQYYAYALNKAYLEINGTSAFDGLRRKYGKKIARASEEPVSEVLAFVNALPRVKGFIALNYGPAAERFYYTQE